MIKTRCEHILPLFDQRLAVLAEICGVYRPMWATAFLSFSKADDRGAASEKPLHWADVERALLRADRRMARERR